VDLTASFSVAQPRRSSRLSLARVGSSSSRQLRPTITRNACITVEDEAGDMISDHGGSSYSSSISPSLSPCPNDAALSFTKASKLSLDGYSNRKSSLKEGLGQDWTTKSRHQYWPAEGWSSAASKDTQAVLQGSSTTKGSRVEWKNLSWRVEEDSPTVQASQKGQRQSKKTRSGRVVKKVEREYPGGVVKKRTRSDPLPVKRRATTPPSTSHLGIGNPNRPQSAMKHRSANAYSLGSRDESMIVVTSHCQMPEAESSPGHSPFVTISTTTSVQTVQARQRLDAPTLQLRRPAKVVEATESNDPDAFSPLSSKSQVYVSRYTLTARPNLPKTDFYERHKEEEGSPTPETRRRGSIPVT
jgi:hypothetical protein